MSVPGIIGMNIINRCRQLVHAEFETTLGGELDLDWRNVIQQVQKCKVDKKAMARLAGKEKVYIPAASVVTVRAQGHVKGAKQGEQMLVESVNTSLPDGLIVLPMLVDPHSHGFSIQVAHLSQEDMWLHPRT